MYGKTSPSGTPHAAESGPMIQFPSFEEYKKHLIDYTRAWTKEFSKLSAEKTEKYDEIMTTLGPLFVTKQYTSVSTHTS